MPTALTVVLATLAVLVAIVGRLYLRARALRPEVYRKLALGDLQPFLRSWGVWLDNRGDILVRHEKVDGTVQFRKHLYKRQPNVLVFRYRNSDDSRRSFPVVRAALEEAKIDYEPELTRRTRKPRAVAVALDVRDVLMPAAALRLIDIVFGALGARTPEFLVWCEGPFQAVPDRDSIPLIAPIAARRAGFRVGVALGRLVRTVRIPRS